MSYFDRIKKIGRIATKAVEIVQDARKGQTVKAVGGAVEIVQAIQDAAKIHGADVAFQNGAAHADAVKAVAVGLDDHESRLAQLESLIQKLHVEGK